MSECRQILCVQISRGMAPPESIASAVSECARHKITYHQINEMPAADAKNAAAKKAHAEGRHLLLVEDDVICTPDLWRAVVDEAHTHSPRILLASARLKNATLNTHFDGADLIYSGTVFVLVPWDALDLIEDPWFQARTLEYSPSSKAWIDRGTPDGGTGSDTWFWMRRHSAKFPAEVIGAATHILHEHNATHCELSNPIRRQFLGMITAPKPNTQEASNA